MAPQSIPQGSGASSLRSNSERYRAVFENSPDGIVLFHIGSAFILDVNRRATEMLGYSPQEAAGFRFHDFPPFKPASAGHRILEGCQNGNELYWEERLATKAGEVVDCEIIGSVYSESGHRAVQLDLRKITTRKLERLAGGVAHRFNNLLTGIMGNASLAVEETAPDSRTALLLEHVVAGAAAGAELTQSLLAYSGADAVTPESLSVSEAIADAADQFYSLIPSRIRVRLDPGSNLPPIDGDRRQIQQVIRSLVLNAAEAISGDGKVNVRAFLKVLAPEDMHEFVKPHTLRAGLCVCVEVEDTGSGIANEILPQIFDPFFSTKFVGRGLGLAAVAAIVRRHGGAIKVKCHKGHGSVFRVFLPVSGSGAVAGTSRLRYTVGWYTQRGSSAK